jgi:hypothetical protein
MRPTWHNWLLRCVALLICISGTALARAVVQDFETHLTLPTRQSSEQQLHAVTLEVRQPVPVQLEGTAVANAPLFVAPKRPSQPVFVWLDLRPNLAVLRVFDALAPPLSF